MSISRDLKAAKSLIDRKETLCRGARSRARDGTEVEVDSISAFAFCSKGALIYRLGSESAIVEHEQYLNRKTAANPNALNYIGFTELKSFEQVMALWDAAIALALAEGK